MDDFVRCIAVFGALVCCSSWSVLADLPMMDSNYELLPMMDSNNEVLPTMENWEWYKALHHKTFHNDSHEEMRREAWFDKLEKIIQHNREEDETGKHGFTLEVNHLADLLPHEYGKLLGYRGRNSTERVERGNNQDQSSDSRDSNDSSLDSKYSSDSSRSSEDSSESSLGSKDSSESSSDSTDSGDSNWSSSDSGSGDRLLGSEHWHNEIGKPSIPETVNWTAEGWVNPVQDQGHCGSCWSFSACGVIEAQYYNATKRSVILSEEQLVECSSDYGNNRCDGGDMSYAFQYIERNGIESYADYPYTNATYHGQPGSCSYAPSRIVTRLLTWHSVPGGNEHALKYAVATFGPISVAIDAASHKFQLYSQGVYQNPDCRSTNADLDHGVLLVGYGTEDGKPYWLIKNSWSVGWGDNGYVKILRDNSNMCGVATVPQFALIR